MRLYEQTVAAGYRASLENKSQKANPHASGSLISRWWVEGFNKGEARKYEACIKS